MTRPCLHILGRTRNLRTAMQHRLFDTNKVSMRPSTGHTVMKWPQEGEWGLTREAEEEGAYDSRPQAQAGPCIQAANAALTQPQPCSPPRLCRYC